MDFCFKLALCHQPLARLVEFFRSGPFEIPPTSSRFRESLPFRCLTPAYRSRNQVGRTFSSQDPIEDIIKLRLKDRKGKHSIIKLLKKPVKVRECAEKLVKFELVQHDSMCM